MKPAAFLQSARGLRLGRLASGWLGFLATALAFLGWIAWQGRGDPWPARARLATTPAIWPLGFSPDGGTFLTADLSPGVSTVTPWDVATGARGVPWTMKFGGQAPTVAFSPDGLGFAAAVVNYPSFARVEVADAATGRPRASFTTEHQIVYRLDWSPDGKSLRAYLGDGARIKEISSWDPATGEKTSSRPIIMPPRANSAGISPDGRVLALCPRAGGDVELWDPSAGRSLGTLTNPATTARASSAWVGFSADGQTLALGREDGSVEIWDVPGRKLLRSIRVHSRGHASAVIRIAPDGRTFASAAWEQGYLSLLGQIWRGLAGQARQKEGEVVVVDIASGRALAGSRTSTLPMYSPDGRTIATLDSNFDVILRDVPPSPR